MKELIEKYGIVEVVAVGGHEFPILNIPMMSDERWKQLAEESAKKHFREWYGREPESVQEAFEGQRAYIEKALA